MNAPAPPAPEPPEPDEAEAREFEAYARTQDPLQLQAALWATRRAQALDAADESEFQRWLAASPRHGEAYRAMVASLEPVRKLPAEKIAALKAALREPTATAPRPAIAAPAKEARAPRPSARGRRAWLRDMGRLVPQAALALVVVATVGGGWLGWDHWRSQPTFAKTYATERGQRLTVDLPDGSTVQLDTATQAEVRLYRARREVRLIDGQAMFAVQAAAQRPFEVHAGGTRVTVVGTRFSVRHTRRGLDAGNTVIAVESGRVQVARADSLSRMGGQDAAAGEAASLVVLGAGQGVTADEAGRLQAVVSVPPGAVAAWRDGRVSFRDTPLAQALAEFERYGPTGLVVRDPAVGAMRLGGSFDVRQIGAFVEALPRLLAVRLERRDGVTEIVRRP